MTTEEPNIKVKYSELESQSTEKLIEMKKQFKIHNAHMENRKTKRDKGYAPKEVRKNIARINQILENRKIK